MIIKVETSCIFVGSETTHFIEVDDDAKSIDIDEVCRALMFDDIMPEFSWEESSEDEADEEGYDIE
jgi:hypothetical protein